MMFGENQRISHIQMERQYQLVFFAPLLLFASKRLQGGMGLLSVAIVMPLLWVALVWMKRSVRICRKIGKYAIFLYQVFLVVAGVFIVAQASQLVIEYMIQGISRWLVIAIFVLGSLAVGNHAQVRGRFAEIAWPVVSGIVGIFFFLLVYIYIF